MDAVPDNVKPTQVLETDPEVRAKRIAEIQASQAEFARADKPMHHPDANPAFQGNLTIVWETEKRELLSRIGALELDVSDLKGKLQQLLESYRLYAPSPTQIIVTQPGGT